MRSSFDLGWTDDVDALAGRVRRASLPLRTASDLLPLIHRLGSARYVLLGEATHGTSEFYTWRAEITCRLIEEQGFSFVGVEGDWPDCYRVNRYVKRMDKAPTSAVEALHAFERWPTWMWGNQETAFIVEWLREHNLGAQRRPVGFYGLDVYSLWDSMRAVVAYLERLDPAAARDARRAYGCFEPYAEDEQAYARATALVPTSCADEAVAMLSALRRRASEYREDGDEAFFDAEQNALVARNAERYYRTMVRGDSESWNVRDRHMVETLERLLEHHGPDAKAVVWAHNTHVGDARYTDMRRDGMVNLGSLLREAHGDDVAIVGFGTHHGTVIAGEQWGAPMRRMTLPAARPGSWEDVCHRATRGRDFLLVFNGDEDGGIARLDKWHDHRAVGVVYRPQYEHYGNYVPTQVPRRYDAFVFVDRSHAVAPLRLPVVEGEMEGYPTGM
jgi:erythromycin esterase-like protein